MKQINLMLGDNMESLKKLEDNSVDSIVSDPPYGLSFMNKKWDYDVPSVELWKEVYRVLKPGGHVLSFGGTRTYHRMVVNIEDAGFEIRDQIMWIYGSGFPKSHNIGKAVDKLNGLEIPKNSMRVVNSVGIDNYDGTGSGRRYDSINYKSKNENEGFGTALKPANEPICVARKPLSESTIAANVLKWGTGGINIDGCRIGTEEKISGRVRTASETGHLKGTAVGVDDYTQSEEGRFPANIIFDESAAEMLDEQASASRFFYIPKVSKSERNMGLDGFEKKENFRLDPNQKTPYTDTQRAYAERQPRANVHPTVKPVQLMAYLCRLVTPVGGIVLDPFMGSGSTGISACLEGFRFIGMEMNEEYFTIASARIEAYEKYRVFTEKKKKKK